MVANGPWCFKDLGNYFISKYQLLHFKIFYGKRDLLSDAIKDALMASPPNRAISDIKYIFSQSVCPSPGVLSSPGPFGSGGAHRGAPHFGWQIWIHFFIYFTKLGYMNGKRNM
jgi:hypothetical protein